MFRIWAKITKGDKIKKSEIFAYDGKYSNEKFNFYLNDICEQMDISSPIALSSHVRNFSSFNITKFKQDDFVEKIDFDYLILEYAADK